MSARPAPRSARARSISASWSTATIGRPAEPAAGWPRRRRTRHPTPRRPVATPPRPVGASALAARRARPGPPRRTPPTGTPTATPVPPRGWRRGSPRRPTLRPTGPRRSPEAPGETRWGNTRAVGAPVGGVVRGALAQHPFLPAGRCLESGGGRGPSLQLLQAGPTATTAPDWSRWRKRPPRWARCTCDALLAVIGAAGGVAGEEGFGRGRLGP